MDDPIHISSHVHIYKNAFCSKLRPLTHFQLESYVCKWENVCFQTPLRQKNNQNLLAKASLPTDLENRIKLQKLRKQPLCCESVKHFFILYYIITHSFVCRHNMIRQFRHHELSLPTAARFVKHNFDFIRTRIWNLFWILMLSLIENFSFIFKIFKYTNGIWGFGASSNLETAKWCTFVLLILSEFPVTRRSQNLADISSLYWRWCDWIECPLVFSQ